MGRRVQPEIRTGILDACTDLALRDGLPDRLEPFAEAAGVSTRMLLYHFGSRDELLRAVLHRARARQLALFTDLLRPQPERPYPEVLEHAWLAMRGPDGEPYLRVFGRLRQDAEQRLWPGFARLATTDWLGPLEEGLATLGRPELATLALAVIRGLLMDLEATGDVDRVDLAFRELLDAVAPTARRDGA